MKKTDKKIYLQIVIGLFLFMSLLLGYQYLALLKEGRDTYQRDAQGVNEMVAQDPSFFTTIFGEIFPFALSCQLAKAECTAQTRAKLDAISVSSVNYARNNEPSNKHPMYFIQLQPDGKIAKLFFSGDLKLEEVNTREEKMVVDLLEGKRADLYGPYFDQEFDVFNKDRRFYDPKPAYLKDLYSQMEVIVPYKNSQLSGGIVYLHGE